MPGVLSDVAAPSRGLQIRYTVVDGQLRVRLSGVMTGTSAPHAVREVDALAVACAARSAVLDLRGVIIAADELGAFKEMRAACLAQRRMHLIPAALIGSEATVPLLRRYAWQMAERGLLRGVFADEQRAQAWAGRQAAAQMLDDLMPPLHPCPPPRSTPAA